MKRKSLWKRKPQRLGENKKRREQEHCLNGYMTIEAIVMWAIITAMFICFVYIFIYLYDIGLMHRAAYEGALQASRMCDAKEAQVKSKAEKIANEMMEQKSLAMTYSVNVEVKKMEVCVTCEGSVKTPVPEFLQQNFADFKAEHKAVEKASRVSGVKLIQLYQHLE